MKNLFLQFLKPNGSTHKSLPVYNCSFPPTRRLPAFLGRQVKKLTIFALKTNSPTCSKMRSYFAHALIACT